MLRNWKPIDIYEFEVEPGFWSGITVLGYAASLSNQGCLGIQTGHWQSCNTGCFSYLRIDQISSLSWHSDLSFRDGSVYYLIVVAKSHPNHLQILKL